MSESSIRLIHLPGDDALHGRITALLVAAFADDRMMIKLLGQDKWGQIIDRYFRFQLDHASHAIMAEEDDQPVGVLLTREPGTARSSWRGLLHFIRVVRLLGRDYGASQQLAQEVSSGIPQGPHWYINQLAVLPRCQSRGIGQRLLARLAELAGHDQVYVDCERSLASYYEAAGFCSIRDFPDLGMVVMGMNEMLTDKHRENHQCNSHDTEATCPDGQDLQG